VAATREGEASGISSQRCFRGRRSGRTPAVPSYSVPLAPGCWLCRSSGIQQHDSPSHRWSTHHPHELSMPVPRKFCLPCPARSSPPVALTGACVQAAVITPFAVTMIIIHRPRSQGRRGTKQPPSLSQAIHTVSHIHALRCCIREGKGSRSTRGRALLCSAATLEYPRLHLALS
jgi:hypothetical protein